MGPILSTCSSVDGRLGCGHFWPVVCRDAVHIHVQVKRCYFAASVETCFCFLGRNWRSLVFGQGAHMSPRARMNPSHITPRLTHSLAQPRNLFGRMLAAGESDCLQPSWLDCILLSGSLSLLFARLGLSQDIFHAPSYYGLLISFRWAQFVSVFNLYVPFVLCWGPKLYMHILHLMFILWIFFFSRKE